MRVISTTDLSHEVNGTYVYKSVSLFEEFGMYNILDVKEFISSMELEETNESECWIESHSAFANIDSMPCDWVIECIEV